jgi:hypothetical protein
MTTTFRITTVAVIVLAATIAGWLVVQARDTTSPAANASLPSLSQRVLLADFSLDTTAAQRREAEQIVGEMADLAAADHGLVAASPFQASALSTIDWPILHRFVPRASDPNSYYQHLDLQQQAAAVKRQLRQRFGHQSGISGTDILGGLIAASELFASEPAGARTLVLASNMWAYDKADGLELKYQRLDQAQISLLIGKLARAGKIARLKGVCVYVVGAGLDPERRIPNAIQISMRSFWAAYFARAGAKLRGWTPTLDAEPSC